MEAKKPFKVYPEQLLSLEISFSTTTVIPFTAKVNKREEVIGK